MSEGFAATLDKRAYQYVERKFKELQRVAEHDIFAPLDLQIFFDVQSNHFYLAFGILLKTL